MKLMKSMGGPCKQFLFYKPPPQPPHQQQGQKQRNVRDASEGAGIDALTSDNTADGQQQQSGAGSGRILAVFDGSRISKELNVTNELKLHGFLLFEWTSGGWFLKKQRSYKSILFFQTNS